MSRWVCLKVVNVVQCNDRRTVTKWQFRMHFKAKSNTILSLPFWKIHQMLRAIVTISWNLFSSRTYFTIRRLPISKFQKERFMTKARMLKECISNELGREKSSQIKHVTRSKKLFSAIADSFNIITC